MALIHAASITPTKAEAIAGWLSGRSWAPEAAAADGVELVGAYRFDDPAGEVGVEGHLVRAGGVTFHVPVTYRGAPLDGADEALMTTLEHTVLGRRWVYDACADPVFLATVCATTLTGTGQATEIQHAEGHLRARTPSVRLVGSGRVDGVVEDDGFGPPTDDGDTTVVVSAGLELRVARRPVEPGGGRDDGETLLGTWPGQERPALLARLLR